MDALTPSYYTLRFASYAEAQAICQSLGYWRPADGSTPEGPITDGMIDGPDGLRGFSIFEIGAVAGKTGYFVNIAGRLPDAVSAYQVPYGSAGVVFAGTQPAQ
jgi:hypothetical protein